MGTQMHPWVKPKIPGWPADVMKMLKQVQLAVDSRRHGRPQLA